MIAPSHENSHFILTPTDQHLPPIKQITIVIQNKTCRAALPPNSPPSWCRQNRPHLTALRQMAHYKLRSVRPLGFFMLPFSHGIVLALANAFRHYSAGEMHRKTTHVRCNQCRRCTLTDLFLHRLTHLPLSPLCNIQTSNSPQRVLLYPLLLPLLHVPTLLWKWRTLPLDPLSPNRPL